MDFTALDAQVAKFRAKSPNIAAAFDEVKKLLGPPPVVVPPPVTSGITLDTTAKLKDALANGKTGQTFKVVGAHVGQLEVTTDEAPVFDFAAATLDGGRDYTPLHIHDCGAVQLLNINATGGTSAGVLINGNANGVKITGRIHDCLGTGLMVQGNVGPNVGLNVDVEIWQCGLSWRTNDPHALAPYYGQPGTGWHASYLGGALKPSSGKFRIRVHDQPSGSACQVGANLTNSTIDLEARRVTRDVQQAPFGTKVPKQVAGSALQLWGGGNRAVKVTHLYAEDCVGGAVETDDVYDSSPAGSIEIGADRVAVRCGMLPFKQHPAVTYR